MHRSNANKVYDRYLAFLPWGVSVNRGGVVYDLCQVSRISNFLPCGFSVNRGELVYAVFRPIPPSGILPFVQAGTERARGEGKKKRLHVLTALVLFLLMMMTTCADSPRFFCSILVQQLRNRTSRTPSVPACLVGQ